VTPKTRSRSKAAGAAKKKAAPVPVSHPIEKPSRAVTKATEAPPDVRLPGGAPRVRITPGGNRQTYEFNGRTFTRDGQRIFTAEELGWTHGDVQEALADPNLIIQPMKD
jgi:hypothetical protein